MQTILLTGALLLIGLFAGELFKKLKLPKITGYLLSGFLLINATGELIPESYLSISNNLITLGLTFIAFEIGGQLSKKKLKTTGKPILLITLFASLLPFIFVTLGMIVVFLIHPTILSKNLVSIIIPASLFMGVLAAPTDPNPLLAISHESKTDEKLTTPIFGIAALDDVLAIILFTLVFAINAILAVDGSQSLLPAIQSMSLSISFAVSLALFAGLIIKLFSHFLEKETDGLLIIVLFGVIFLITGLKSILEFDVVISGITLGWFVRNFVHCQAKLFSLLERYSEEMILLLFFILSGLHLKIAQLTYVIPFITIFVLLRALGKYLGIKIGNTKTKSPLNAPFTFISLLPQGGIVIGLALLVLQTPSFEKFSLLVFNTVLGATIIHEVVGPILMYRFLDKSKTKPAQ